MATKWTTVTFGEVVTLAQGLCFNAKSNHLMAEKGIPLLRIADLINNTQTKFVDAERVPKKYISNPKDIIYTRTGQVGLVFKGKVGVVHNNCFRVLPQNGIEPDYVYWYLTQPSVIEKARSLAGGAAQPDLGHDAFKSISFTYPEPDVQRRIAGILSAYDELIENSQRRIRLLEDMARALYREWFVHFRFPRDPAEALAKEDGHESVPRLPSALGGIPQGWEVKSLADLMDIRGGSQPPKSEFVYEPQDGYVRLIQIRDYESDSHLTFVRESSRLRMVERTEIMIARYGASVARICSGLAGAYNVALAKVIPTVPNSQEFLRQFLSDDEFQKLLIGMSGRAAQNGFNKSDIAAVRVAVPIDGRVLQQFERFAVPIRDSILALRDKIENLRGTRDLLLPRLLSGQVELSTVEVSA